MSCICILISDTYIDICDFSNVTMQWFDLNFLGLDLGPEIWTHNEHFAPNTRCSMVQSSNIRSRCWWWYQKRSKCESTNKLAKKHSNYNSNSGMNTLCWALSFLFRFMWWSPFSYQVSDIRYVLVKMVMIIVYIVLLLKFLPNLLLASAIQKLWKKYWCHK